MEEQILPVMAAIGGKSGRHLTKWQWHPEDPLVVRLQIQSGNGGIAQWEVGRETLVAAAVHGEPRSGFEGGNLWIEIPDITAIPSTWMIMAALLHEWDQEGEILLLHMTTLTGEHLHLFVPALWLAPFLEKTTAVVADGAETYDVDQWISQIFEEAEGMNNAW